MTVGELRDFCEAREVEITMRYSQDYDSIIIEIRKNGRSANMAIPRDIAVAKNFGAVARAAFEKMADKLEEAEKGNKAAAALSRP